MGKNLNLNEALLIVEEYKSFMEDYVEPYLKAAHNGFTIADLVLDRVDIHGGFFVFLGMPEEYDGDYPNYYREDSEVRIPFSLIVDYAGTINKLNEGYHEKVRQTVERQKEQDLKELARLKAKYPDA